jgi:hypothetical protein
MLSDKKTIEIDNQTLENLEFNRKNIESLPYVKLMDSDEENNVDLFCYLNCKKTDNEFIQRCRGIVFNNDKLVFQSFPYNIEYTDKDYDEVCQTIGPIFKDCLFYKSYEGCLVRIFNINNKWYISTNKKLDVFKSKWSSKQSYGIFFRDALMYQLENNEKLKEKLKDIEINHDNIIDVFCNNILDKERQYMFLLLNNTENRIVCKEPEHPTVYHVGTFINEKLNMEDDIYIPYPELLNFNSIDDIYLYNEQIDYNFLQGVIIFAPNNRQYKILNTQYYNYYNIRGNEPSIKYRYLQVRMNLEQNKMLQQLYPNSKKDFEEYENYIFEASKNIYNAYVNRYIKKLYVTVPSEEYNVIKEAHTWYLEDRKNNKITYEKIINILNKQTSTNLNKIIKRLKLGKVETTVVEKDKKHYTQKRLLNTITK